MSSQGRAVYSDQIASQEVQRIFLEVLRTRDSIFKRKCTLNADMVATRILML